MSCAVPRYQTILDERDVPYLHFDKHNLLEKNLFIHSKYVSRLLRTDKKIYE